MNDSKPNQIHFVSGKGGVGKSTVAAAMALEIASRGESTLLVELGERSFYQDFLKIPALGMKPQNWRPHLDVALWSGAECLLEYAQHLVKVATLVRLFFENPVSKALIQTAPGLPELAILGKITSGIRKIGPPLNYQNIVVDAFATGHFLSLLRAPEGMAQAIRFGPMGEQSRSILQVLNDPQICHYHVVAIPEELPIIESLELVSGIESVVGVKPQLVLNRWVKTPDEALNEKPNDESWQKFQDYLKSVEIRQNKLSKEIKNQISDIQILSQVWSPDSEVTLQTLAQEMKR